MTEQQLQDLADSVYASIRSVCETPSDAFVAMVMATGILYKSCQWKSGDSLDLWIDTFVTDLRNCISQLEMTKVN